MRQVEERRRLGGINSARGAKQGLELIAAEHRLLREEVEDAAAVFFDDDDATGVSTSRSGARPPMSWSRPRSPVTIVVGRPLAWAAPMPEETRPSMPLAPRLQRKRTSASLAARNASWSRIGMLEAV